MPDLTGSIPDEALELCPTIREWRTSGFVRAMQKLLREKDEDPIPTDGLYGLRPRRFAIVQGTRVVHIFVEDPDPTNLRRWITLWWWFDATDSAELWLIDSGGLVSGYDLEMLEREAHRLE